MADIAQKENIMGTQKMSKLILFTGIPLMISLFINSLYNFVDSMFVSQVSEKALTALSLAASVQLLVSALGLGNAVSLNAVISKALGRKDTGEVLRAADAAISIALCSWVLITILCLLFVKSYFAWQSGGDEVIARYAEGNSVAVKYIDNKMVVVEPPVLTNFYLAEGEKQRIGKASPMKDLTY